MQGHPANEWGLVCVAQVKVVDGQEDEMEEEGWSRVTAGMGQVRCSARKRGQRRREEEEAR